MYPHVNIVTHSGSFHTDDVFAVATLLLLLEKKPVEVRVIRSREQAVIDQADFAVDVGNIYDPAANRFDHHQTGGAGMRDNKVPYAAFGLLWKQFGVEISGSAEISARVDRVLVQPIDYGDNLGLPLAPLVPDVYPYTLDRIISAFGSTYEEKKVEIDAVFLELVAFAKRIIQREIVKAVALEHASSAVKRAYIDASDKRVVVLDEEYPWYDTLSNYPEPLFVVFPDEKSGNWGISAVRVSLHEFKNRRDFPVAWAGKRAKDLAEVSGVSDAVFCHNRLFFAVAKSKEGAITLAERALSTE
ncbi:MAG: hypothetical protein A2664_00505 [Candidatus Taylorbacteria bacterium RIFCSPHIGHO2_01_FULL_46_22b]|uniref:Metal-dependent hydrolase n=1 Tax=Candidatus Taylorbacteria bacterium RIFCSPHIGHO2_01_FULL_46_22b TaxID=1802301 RepID=A0A1G2M5U5_9BACT|nr:MAG: hypothetical protein A2664_00505 [Candidatus Taylorbacteria bacterium RIFCSPHIGHO2_01_FULL_46_22b]